MAPAPALQREGGRRGDHGLGGRPPTFQLLLGESRGKTTPPRLTQVCVLRARLREMGAPDSTVWGWLGWLACPPDHTELPQGGGAGGKLRRKVCV